MEPRDIPSDEEILAMEISEDKRLREIGIDPDGDPIDIMMEIHRRAQKLKEKEPQRSSPRRPQ
jgi:hypothetical protein